MWLLFTVVANFFRDESTHLPLHFLVWLLALLLMIMLGDQGDSNSSTWGQREGYPVLVELHHLFDTTDCSTMVGTFAHAVCETKGLNADQSAVVLWLARWHTRCARRRAWCWPMVDWANLIGLGLGLGFLCLFVSYKYNDPQPWCPLPLWSEI